VNQLIKKREQYRPFAPVVLQENLREYFDVAQPDGALPFMTFVVPVRESARTLLGATTHIDGTARVQSVSRETNPALWNLINEFAKLTGVPVLLNTSFNNDAEPIVDSVDDAVCCYLTTGLDFLVLGDYLVSRRSKDELRSALLDCYPALRSSRKLVKKNLERIMYSIESTKSVYFERSPVAISAEIFHVLEHSDGRQSCRALFRKVGIPQAGSSALLSELMDLWSARVVTIRPPGLSENQALEPAVSAVRFPSSAN
jgi:carbamoyltransferase